jgi:hypothetical protein
MGLTFASVEDFMRYVRTEIKMEKNGEGSDYKGA